MLRLRYWYKIQGCYATNPTSPESWHYANSRRDRDFPIRSNLVGRHRKYPRRCADDGGLRTESPEKNMTDPLEKNVASATTAQRWLVHLGSIGPLGHLPASGTATVAIAGIPLFWLFSKQSLLFQIIFAIVFGFAAIWLHHNGDKIVGEKDSRLLVWDELAGFFVAIIAVPFTWQLAVIAFFAERIIDIAKVPPAKQIEDHWPGGWGVVGDDIVAGLYTLGLLHLAMRLIPPWVGLGNPVA